MNTDQSRISRRRAFLIHLREESRTLDDRLLGRVEHVASSRAEQFESEAELWAFVFRILEEEESDG